MVCAEYFTDSFIFSEHFILLRVTLAPELIPREMECELGIHLEWDASSSQGTIHIFRPRDNSGFPIHLLGGNQRTQRKLKVRTKLHTELRIEPWSCEVGTYHHISHCSISLCWHIIPGVLQAYTRSQICLVSAADAGFGEAWWAVAEETQCGVPVLLTHGVVEDGVNGSAEVEKDEGDETAVLRDERPQWGCERLGWRREQVTTHMEREPAEYEGKHHHS